MVEVVSSLCFPKSKEYLKMMCDEFLQFGPVIAEDSFSEQDSFEEFSSFVFDVSYPVSLFLRVYALECDCPCGGLSLV